MLHHHKILNQLFSEKSEKLQRLPKLPKCMDDVYDYLDMDEVISTKGENLVIFNDKSCNVIIFSCESNLKFICAVLKLFWWMALLTIVQNSFRLIHIQKSIQWTNLT